MSGRTVALSLALGIVGVALVLLRWKRNRNTTLVGPWSWEIASIVAVSATEVTAAWEPMGVGTIQLFRLAAACATFCPTVSLLGARRPLDRGWHFVVLSLWVVLMLPTLETLILQPGQGPDVRGLRSVFVLLLAALGLVNRLPTRYWLSSLLLAVSQIQLLLPHLVDVQDLTPKAASLARMVGATESENLGLVTLTCSLAVATLVSWRSRRAQPLDKLWLDFRDAYGLLWSLRVAEQINSSAAMKEGGLTLHWSGFRRAGARLQEPLAEETDRLLRQNFNNLLRRFVTREWIAERLPPRVN